MANTWTYRRHSTMELIFGLIIFTLILKGMFVVLITIGFLPFSCYQFSAEIICFDLTFIETRAEKGKKI